RSGVEQQSNNSRTRLEQQSKRSRSLPEAESKPTRTTVEQLSNSCRTSVEEIKCVLYVCSLLIGLRCLSKNSSAARPFFGALTFFLPQNDNKSNARYSVYPAHQQLLKPAMDLAPDPQ